MIKSYDITPISGTQALTLPEDIAEDLDAQLDDIGRIVTAVEKGGSVNQAELFVKIEGFVRDDYYGDAPYMLPLTSHGGDEVLYTRLKGKVLDQAKAVKFPASDAKKQLKAMEAAHRDLLPRVTSQAPVGGGAGFRGLERFFGDSEVQYGVYTCDDSGVMGTTALGVPVRVCPHPVIVSKAYKSIMTGSESVDVSYSIDGVWHTIRQIPKAEIASSQSIVKVLADKGVFVTSETAKPLVNYLSDFQYTNREIIPTTATTAKLGWTDSGDFVPVTGDVEFDALTSSGYQRMGMAIHPHGDANIWLEAMRGVRKKSPVSVRIMMAAAFASVLIQPMHKLPFWVHICGDSDNGKTVALRVCASIWGDSARTGAWIQSMKTTDVGLEQLAAFANNLPLCLDELQTIQDDKHFATTVYNICQGSGKVRGARAGGLRETSYWSLTAISTGEQRIVTDGDHAGSNNRVLSIKTTERLFEDPRSLCGDILDKSYGHAGKMFLDGLSQEDISALIAKVNALAKKFEGFGIADKQADAGAIILVADELATKYVFKDGNQLTEDDVRSVLKTKDAIDDNRNAYDALIALISENSNAFVTSGYMPSGKIWGRIDKDQDRVMLNNAIFKTELAKLGYDAARFADWALARQIIVDHRTPTDRHYTTKTRINGTPTAVVDIDLSRDPDTPPLPF